MIDERKGKKIHYIHCAHLLIKTIFTYNCENKNPMDIKELEFHQNCFLGRMKLPEAKN